MNVTIEATRCLHEGCSVLETPVCTLRFVASCEMIARSQPLLVSR